MLFTEIIRNKRDGGELSAEEVAFFVDGLTDGSVPAEQVSALAMAIFLRSMTLGEAGELTRAMANSGSTLQWDQSELGGPVVDKHSTGGVGDKVSFLLAPIAAACGCFVPMISGRGLGHTGGTLDKIASIPGYCGTPDRDRLRQVVSTVGCAIIGQTDDLAPADRRLYSIRDVTGTVESIPLITASILSKKIAAGNRALVMDIKTGTGAFMATLDQAVELANSIIGTAGIIGLKTHALITDMNEVLGLSAGNAVEIIESIDYLTGVRRDSRLNEVVMALTAEMLVMTDVETSRERARQKVEVALHSGAATEVFARMVAALGGPIDFVERYASYLPTAAVTMPVMSKKSGYIGAVDARAIGSAIIGLGGGRRNVNDVLDLSVGFTEVVPIGSSVAPDRPIALVHANSQSDAERAAAQMIRAFRITPSRPEQRRVIYQTMSA